MTTTVTIDTHAGWPVRVSYTNAGTNMIVLPFEKRDVYIHDGCDLIIHEVQPGEGGPSAPTSGVGFGAALAYLKAGHKVARRGWNGKEMFLFLVKGSTFKVNRPPLLGIYPEGTEINYQAHIDMKTAQGTIVPWLASQTDVLAEDWEFVR